MGRKKIVTVAKNTGVPRRPFRTEEREKHFALLAQQVIALDADQKKVKERKDAIDRIKADIVAGGFVEEDQIALPIFDDPADGEEGDGADGSEPSSEKASDKPPPMLAAQEQARKANGKHTNGAVPEHV